MKAKGFGAARRDGAAFGFGVAFVVFGAAGLLRAMGVPIGAIWLYPLVLVGLGAAGLLSLLVRGR